MSLASNNGDDMSVSPTRAPGLDSQLPPPPTPPAAVPEDVEMTEFHPPIEGSEGVDKKVMKSSESFEEPCLAKRGLSQFYSGKSKTFKNLANVRCIKDLEKEERPLSKKRRLTMANKWASRTSRQSPLSDGLFPLKGEEEVDDEEEEQNGEQLGIKSCFHF